MKTLYHGTSSVNLASIKALGLVPRHAKGGDRWATEHHMRLAQFAKKREPSVFITDEAENAEDFAHYAVEEIGGDPVIIKLHVPEDVFSTYVVDELYDSDLMGKPHAWRAHSVDASYIVRVMHVPKTPASEVALVEMLEQMLVEARV